MLLKTAVSLRAVLSQPCLQLGNSPRWVLFGIGRGVTRARMVSRQHETHAMLPIDVVVSSTASTLSRL